jgi:hypothetical protein
MTPFAAVIRRYGRLHFAAARAARASAGVPDAGKKFAESRRKSVFSHDSLPWFS